MEKALQQRLEKRASIYSIILVLIALITKTTVIFFTNSVSYRGEFTDSIIDIVIVVITFFSLKMSQRPADADHMYGHYKINSFMGIIESFLTMGLYGYIFYSAILALINYNQYTVENPLLSIFSLLGIILVNIFISTQIVRIGKKLNNSVIKAQGVNFRGDLIRNIAVICALIGAYFNIHIIDPILAIIAVVYAYYESIKIIRVSFNELIDYNAVNPDRIEKVKQDILKIPDVHSLHHFALRTVGRKLELSVRVVLNSEKKGIESQEITNAIKTITYNQFTDYDINSFIEISDIETDFSLPIFSEISNKIEKISNKFSLIQDIHHLSIDRLEDVALIQFHVNVNQNISLNEVHSVVSQMEANIIDFLSEKFPGVPNEIITHIEPYEEKLDFTVRKMSLTEKETVEKIIREATDTIPEILSYKLIYLLEQSSGFLLSIIIYVDGSKSIFDAHLLAELLEINLKQSIPELHNCIIHTEPAEK